MTGLADLAGTDLGVRTATYGDRDVMLYAVAVGAGAGDLDLVYEPHLRVLPTFALTLGLWAVEAAGGLGAYDRMTSLHAAQTLDVREPLPASATVEMSARVADVWDKGRASMVDIAVDCRWFSAVYAIYLPGLGGWGGPRGESRRATEPVGAYLRQSYATSRDQAVLYRLTGDRHPVHVDPATAAGYGLDRPILHGLCTLGVVTRVAAEAVGEHPAELRRLAARFAAPVYPGDRLDVAAARASDGGLTFTAEVDGAAVLTTGSAR
ncbi:MAG: enoyl-CoA hydratase [Streptosporangiales bacterium]|nr:enoyl-CoA hydratase [Streptosporangiales bacterium]